MPLTSRGLDLPRHQLPALRHHAMILALRNSGVLQRSRPVQFCWVTLPRSRLLCTHSWAELNNKLFKHWDPRRIVGLKTPQNDARSLLCSSWRRHIKNLLTNESLNANHKLATPHPKAFSIGLPFLDSLCNLLLNLLPRTCGQVTNSHSSKLLASRRIIFFRPHALWCELSKWLGMLLFPSFVKYGISSV